MGDDWPSRLDDKGSSILREICYAGWRLVSIISFVTTLQGQAPDIRELSHHMRKNFTLIKSQTSNEIRVCSFVLFWEGVDSAFQSDSEKSLWVCPNFMVCSKFVQNFKFVQTSWSEAFPFHLMAHSANKKMGRAAQHKRMKGEDEGDRWLFTALSSLSPGKSHQHS